VPDPPASSAPWPLLHDAILGWYASNGRPLPFRRTRDPYAILVSEAMAQQTQAARAGEAWVRFMETFPTATALASATPADVLRAWQGLGYNRRALNLWRAARRIVEVHGGHVPSDPDALDALPGVGPYTARAVAAIAFGMPVGAVDTNVRRVIGRIVGGDGGVPGPAAMQLLADAAVPADHPGAWTHALMDVGATICLPRRPDCAACPAASWCRYADESAAASGRGMGSVVPSVQPSRRVAAREVGIPFTATSRWLRGRIIDRLRTAGEDWVVVGGPIGTHDHAAVTAALDALAGEGLVELDVVDASAPGGRRVRLPIR
jgi:A/G-specific adenine glycosylase